MVSRLIDEFVVIGSCLYYTLLRFWPVGELALLADGPAGCGEVARSGYLFACNFGVTRTTAPTKAERRR